jgi:hypothetical protein
MRAQLQLEKGEGHRSRVAGVATKRQLKKYAYMGITKFVEISFEEVDQQ